MGNSTIATLSEILRRAHALCEDSGGIGSSTKAMTDPSVVNLIQGLVDFDLSWCNIQSNQGLKALLDSLISFKDKEEEGPSEDVEVKKEATKTSIKSKKDKVVEE